MSEYDPAAIEPWGNFADELADKPYIQRQMRHHWQVDDWTWDDWAPHVAASLGAVSCVDHCLGMLMDALERLGIADNTLLVYSTDHGDLLGSHGMFDKHNVLYEEILRVPLLMRWPGRIAPGGESHDAVSNCLDLAPTFLELAGRELPERIDGGLIGALAAAPVAARVVVIHANHPREIGPRVVEALRRLAGSGVRLLNQAVLLAGVNDELAVQAELGEVLFEAGVLPYYLHQLDPVAGAAHFAVADERARALHRELRETQPGYLVPRLVRELPGEPSKTPL